MRPEFFFVIVEIGGIFCGVGVLWGVTKHIFNIRAENLSYDHVRGDLISQAHAIAPDARSFEIKQD